jgi:hypothetical protein
MITFDVVVFRADDVADSSRDSTFDGVALHHRSHRQKGADVGRGGGDMKKCV